jgi:hypothetical protein
MLRPSGSGGGVAPPPPPPPPNNLLKKRPRGKRKLFFGYGGGSGDRYAFKLLFVFLSGCLFFSFLLMDEVNERGEEGRRRQTETTTMLSLGFKRRRNREDSFSSSSSSSPSSSRSSSSSVGGSGLKEKVLSMHKEMARYVRVRGGGGDSRGKNRRAAAPSLDDDEDEEEEEENFTLKPNANEYYDDDDEKKNNNDSLLTTRTLLPKPRFLIGGASRRAMAALTNAGEEDGGGGSGAVFEGRRKAPSSAKDLPVVPEIPERLKRMDVEYVTERRVIPVKPRIAPERPRGQKKKSSGEDDEEEDGEDVRKSADTDDKPSKETVSSSSSPESSKDAPKLTVEKVEEQQQHERDEDDSGAIKSDGESSEEHPPEQKPTPMQKAVLKAATYRLGGTKLKKLMDTDVDIFLSKSTLNDIDPDEKRNKITCGGKPVMQIKTYDQLRDAVPELSEYIPDEDDIHTRGGLKPDSKSLGRRCAVVGNSGSLLDHAYGSEIDSHDAVIRFNAAPTKGYEKHVGKKTTIRVQNIDNLGFREPKDEMLVFTARDEKTFRHFSEYQKKKYLKHKEKMQIQRAFNPEFWCHVWDWVDRRKLKPSSGFAGVVMALRACSGKVSLYGFSHNATRFHYFNHLDEKVTTQEVYQYHPLAEESEAYRFLEFHKRLVKKD